MCQRGELNNLDPLLTSDIDLYLTWYEVFILYNSEGMTMQSYVCINEDKKTDQNNLFDSKLQRHLKYKRCKRLPAVSMIENQF